MLIFMASIVIDISLTISWWVTKQLTTTAINTMSYLISVP